MVSSKAMKRTNHIATYVLLVFIAGAAVVWSWWPGEVRFGELENIQSIPFTRQAERIQVFEDLAHVDAYIDSSRVAKALHVRLAFIPHHTKKLSLGVRESGFWYSYSPREFYAATGNEEVGSIQYAEVILPLTAVFQEEDATIDLMFFADDAAPDNNPLTERAFWELTSLEAQTAWKLPTRAEVSDYIRSFTSRERAL
jgi:hypothetical protein